TIISESGLSTIAEIDDIISGIYREPKITLIAGNTNPETIHKELRCKFKLNVLQIMFSAGNHGERKRLIEIVSQLQKQKVFSQPLKILDMFACIGNLSLPIAVNLSDIEVHGIEINDNAYQYLIETIVINNLAKGSSYYASHGDNRKIIYKKKFHIIIMGYFQIEKSHLKTALENLEKPFAIIFVHDVIFKNEPPKTIVLMEELLKEEMFSHLSIKKRNIHKIKSLSPSVNHVVIEYQINSDSNVKMIRKR
ncbi:MAG: hypothetical protein ACFFD1_05570, partial [Candidatus Thorarchaeota archaeon]